jgi:hypothetical protein
LKVSKDGYAPRCVELDARALPAGDPADPLIIPLSQGVEVRGVVLSVEGRPVEKQSVGWWYTPIGLQSKGMVSVLAGRVETDALGQFTFKGVPPGPLCLGLYQVIGFPPKGRSTYSSLRQLTVQESNQEVITFHVGGGTALRGTLTKSSAFPMRRICLTLFDPPGDRIAVVETMPGNTFEFFDLTPGRYRLELSASTGIQSMAVSIGTQTVELGEVDLAGILPIGK